MKLSEIIKTARKKKNISLEDASKLLGVSKQLICDWESGRREPNASTFVKLSQILRINTAKIDIKITHRRKIKQQPDKAIAETAVLQS